MALALPERCVVLLVGASGAGKSTLSQQLAGQSSPAARVISYDACREELTGDVADQSATTAAVALAHRRLAQACAAGAPVVVDATHTRGEHRRQVLTIAAAHHRPCVAVALVTPLATCLARQLQRPPRRPGALWGRRVPSEVVTAQHAEVQAALTVLPTEGYTAIHIISQDDRK